VVDNTYLGQVMLSRLPRATHVEVTFAIDADGILAVTAREPRTKRAAQVTIRSSSGLTEEQLESIEARRVARRRRERQRQLKEAAKERERQQKRQQGELVLASEVVPEPEPEPAAPTSGELEFNPPLQSVEPVALAGDDFDDYELPLPEPPLDGALRGEENTHPLTDDSSESGRERLIGITIGERYVVEEYLGGGAMGRVYAARHKVLKKRFAIKMMHPMLATEQDLAQRFVREAQTASSIESDHVVGISDFGQLEDGTSYFVMEYLDGPTLSRFIKEHAPMDVELIREIALQIGEGLAAAHAQQIVHRDLKPDNVTVTARSDRPVFCKILDFGIAKVLSGTTSGPRTMAGSVIGTPYYMPPEQVEGEEVDARSDLYSLGVVLFEMATGRRPFNQSSAAAVMHSHKYDPPPSIRELRRGQPLPGPLEEIILCLMAKDRRERFQSANELIEALRAIAGE
jgi:serine/threonine-protein kinase